MLLSDCSHQKEQTRNTLHPRQSERVGTPSPLAFARDQLAHATLFGKRYFLLPISTLLFLELTLVFVWRKNIYIYILSIFYYILGNLSLNSLEIY